MFGPAVFILKGNKVLGCPVLQRALQHRLLATLGRQPWDCGPPGKILHCYGPSGTGFLNNGRGFDSGSEVDDLREAGGVFRVGWDERAQFPEQLRMNRRSVGRQESSRRPFRAHSPLRPRVVQPQLLSPSTQRSSPLPRRGLPDGAARRPRHRRPPS